MLNNMYLQSILNRKISKKEKLEESPTEEREDYVIHHIDREHHCGAFQLMNQMRLQRNLCDITIHVNEQEFCAHKLVLASCSPYFHAMFTNDMIEKDSCVITLHEVNPYALKLLLDFAYTAEVVVSEYTVQMLLPAASLLQMNSVRDACCKFLMKQLHPSNCLGIRSFADTHSCQDLLKQSHQYTLKNYLEVCHTEEFLILPVKQVEDLINSDDLCNVSEEEIFDSVVRWIKHDMQDREQYVYKLMSCVKLPLLCREFFMSHVESELFIRNNQDCKELLLQAMKYHLLPEQRTSLQTSQTMPRRCNAAVPGLLAVGGGSLFAIHTECEYYSPVTDAWSRIPPMSTRRARAGVTSVDNCVYAVGGYDGASDLSSAECYSPLSNTWTKIQSMGTKRSSLGVCDYNGLLYAAGGYDSSSCLSSIERYDPLSGTWSAVQSMSNKRRYLSLAVIEGLMYAIGGYDGCSHLPSVERYDCRTNIWTPVSCMISRRSNAGVGILNGMIYVCGGSDGATILGSCERFNPRRELWESVTSMHSRRSTHDAVVMDGFLYCIGGNDGSTSLNTAERYDPKTNRWMLISAMSLRRSSVGVAMVETCNLPKSA